MRGKKVFISGSSSGLGYEMAQCFGNNGAKVLLNGKDRQKLIKASNAIGNSDYFQGDVSSEESCKKIKKEIMAKYQTIDVIICNVGSGKSVPAGQENITEWKRVFDLNFWSSINTIYSLIDLLEKNKNSSVICISSICGLERIQGAPITYSVAKAALNAFVQAVAPVLAESGIRINAIVPGNLMFPGSSWEKKKADDPAGIEKMLDENVPLKRFGRGCDISKAAAYLAGEDGLFITGALWKIDGGQAKSLM